MNSCISFCLKVEEAVAGASTSTIAGKALAGMSCEQISLVEGDLKNSLERKTNSMVKSSVVQVNFFSIFLNGNGEKIMTHSNLFTVKISGEYTYFVKSMYRHETFLQ